MSSENYLLCERGILTTSQRAARRRIAKRYHVKWTYGQRPSRLNPGPRISYFWDAGLQPQQADNITKALQRALDASERRAVQP